MAIIKTQQIVYFKLLTPLLFIILFLCLNSCNLFDKEFRQDEHIAKFRAQMAQVLDSIDKPLERIEAYKTIQQKIKEDKDIITPRKKNNLLVENNIYISAEYFEVGDLEQSLNYNNQAIDLCISNAKSYYNRGRIYQTSKQDTLALADYSKAISLDPNLTDAYYNRGLLFQASGDYDKAIEDFTIAIKYKPEYLAVIYNSRGSAFLAKSNFENAIDDYSAAIKLDTLNVMALINRADAYVGMKHIDKALDDCSKAIAIDSTSYVFFYTRRAHVYELLKDYPEALKDYEKVIELDPYNKYKERDVAKQAIRKITSLNKKKVHRKQK